MDWSRRIGTILKAAASAADEEARANQNGGPQQRLYNRCLSALSTDMFEMFGLELRASHNLQLVGQVPRLSNLTAVPFELDEGGRPSGCIYLVHYARIVIVVVRVFPR